MSEATNNDNSINENDEAPTKSQSKKKERRQKSKDAASVQNESIETVKNDEYAEAGTSATSPTLTLDPNLDAQLKMLLAGAAKGKGNANLLPLLRDKPKTEKEAMQKSYKFWSTQPVPKFDDVIEANEAIEANKEIAQIRADPYALPEGFKWESMTLDDPLVLKELYTLLNENYVEDDDAMFRFDYQPEFLRWALQPPGWRKGISNISISCVRQCIYRFIFLFLNV